jgi:K+-sensing histidine kinase KdpD
MGKTQMLVSELDVPQSIINKWQRLVNALAQLMGVPTAIIMKYEHPYLEAIITSENEGNPIPKNYRETIFDKYCEITIKKKKIHEVPNAYKDPIHKNKPGLEENELVSYLGFPLEWPTGDIFGTICVLDKKERHFSEKKKNLMKEMKVAVDAHLELIFNNETLRRAQEKIKEQRDNLKLLTSTVRHEIANNLTFIYGFLQMKQETSQLPNEIIETLMPHIQSILDSIEHIEELKELFTRERSLREINPRNIIEQIKKEYTQSIEIEGTCTVLADDYLDLLLKELIRNAFKHTDTKKIDISLSEDDNSAKIRIQDYGPGLPQRIIDSHFQNPNQNRKLKGLTIIEKIMDRYGGKIIYNKNDKGALFELIWDKHMDKP